MKELVGIKSTQPQIQSQPQPHLGQPTLGQSIVQGMAFGGGSGIAHAFIGRLFGSGSGSGSGNGSGSGSGNGSGIGSRNENKVEEKKTQYDNCLEITKNNYEACEHLNV